MDTIPEEQIGEIPLELSPDLDAELVEEFISDAREQLENIEQGTLALEKNIHDQAVIHSLFRAFHSFKGNASFLDFTAISQLAHTLESLLDGARENRLQINSVMVDIILKSRDTLKRFVDEMEAQITGKKPRQVVHIPTAVLKAAARHIVNSGEAPAPKVAPVATETPAATPAPSTAPATTEKKPALMPTTMPICNPVAKLKPSTYVGGTALHAVKVSTSRLDGLVDLAGELLIAQSLIVQNFSSPGVNRHTIARNLEQLNRIGKELQRTAMSMRMVPIRATFQKMQSPGARYRRATRKGRRNWSWMERKRKLTGRSWRRSAIPSCIWSATRWTTPSRCRTGAWPWASPHGNDSSPRLSQEREHRHRSRG